MREALEEVKGFWRGHTAPPEHPVHANQQTTLTFIYTDCILLQLDSPTWHINTVSH